MTNFQWLHSCEDLQERLAPVLLAMLLCLSPSLVHSQSPTGAEVQDCLVRFAKEVKVPALETGRVAEVTVAINDMVDAGSAIARLNDHSLLTRRRHAMLRLNSARRDAASTAEIEYAERSLDLAQNELATSRLIQNDVLGAVPRSQLEKLKLAVEHGKIEVELANQRKRRAQVEADLREAEVAEIDDQLKNLISESPIDGVVLDVARSPGEWITKGDALVTIGQIDRLHVHALASSREIAPASCRDLPVSVHWVDPSTGKPRSLRGKVLSADPRMLPGGFYRLHAEIVNETLPQNPNQWHLHPGAEVHMKVYQSAATARTQAMEQNLKR